MFRIDHYIFVFLDYIDDMQLDAQLFGHPQGVIALYLVAVSLADRVGMPFDAKACIKIDTLDANSLILDQFRGQ